MAKHMHKMPSRAKMQEMMGGMPARKFHNSPDEYNDTALAETPARTHYTRDPEMGSDAHPRAVGMPAGVRVAAGTENLRTAAETFDAGITRPAPGNAQGRRPAGVKSYQDGAV